MATEPAINNIEKRPRGRPRKTPPNIEATPKKRAPKVKIEISNEELLNTSLTYDELYKIKVRERRLQKLKEWYDRAKLKDPILFANRVKKNNLKFKDKFIEKNGVETYNKMMDLYRLRYREKKLLNELLTT